ncbi:MAG: hypothetical protein RIR00_799 [Pseudomonadota bacterium]|jgi:hypothetical protein
MFELSETQKTLLWIVGLPLLSLIGSWFSLLHFSQRDRQPPKNLRRIEEDDDERRDAL